MDEPKTNHRLNLSLLALFIVFATLGTVLVWNILPVSEKRFDAKDPRRSIDRMIKYMVDDERKLFTESLTMIAVECRLEALDQAEDSEKRADLGMELAKKVDGLTAAEINSKAELLRPKVEASIEPKKWLKMLRKIDRLFLNQ